MVRAVNRIQPIVTPAKRLARLLWIGCWLVLSLASGAIPLNAGQPVATREWSLEKGPSPAQITRILDDAEANAWVGQSTAVTAHAIRCYEKGNLEVAYAWHGVGRWIQYIGLSQGDCMRGWMSALKAAKLDNVKVRGRDYRVQTFGTMAMLLPRELRLGIPSHPAMLAGFFENVSVYDCPTEVFAILKRLFEDDPLAFHEYYNLALAIAIVYDVPPPLNWPHIQVKPGLVAEKLQDPVAIFHYFVELDRAGRSRTVLRQVPTNELKFMVDISAGIEELQWARDTQDKAPGHFAELYPSVHYRMDRIQVFTPVWDEGPYTLQAIQAKGGICIDQAYFTSQVGKALGIPTLCFKGAAMDLRHAWVGYFNHDKKWILDVGRSSQFNRSGVAWCTDPQSWASISEQDLTFLEERHQARPKVHEAIIHLAFARSYLMLNQSVQGEAALRAALELDPVNAQCWDLYLLSLRKRKAPRTEEVSLLREAVKAMKGLPDVEAKYSSELCSVLRALGRGQEADKEAERLATKYRKTRDDLSALQVSQVLWAVCQEDNPQAQLAEYRQLMEHHAKNGGVIFMDIVVSPFVRFLLEHGHKSEALQAVQVARGVLKIESGGMIEKELVRLTGLAQ